MINGAWLPEYGLPGLRVGVRLPGYADTWSVIRFVLDTGSAVSCIHPLDAVRVLGLTREQLDSANWSGQASTSTGIGGEARYLPIEGSFAFFDADPRAMPLVLSGTIDLAEVMPSNQFLPSLLGWDILQHFRTTFHGRSGIHLELR